MGYLGTKTTSLLFLAFSLLAFSNATFSKIKKASTLTPKRIQKVKKTVSTPKKQPIISNDLLSKVRKTDRTFMGWGIDNSVYSSINLNKSWQKITVKKDIVVAVIDTGIDPQHPFLKDNLYVPNKKITLKQYGIDFSKNGKKSHKFRPMDTHGHGTHVAGIVKSVHPGVKILALKYYDKKSSGKDNLDSTIEALRYAVKQNVDIINYSGGGAEPSLEELRILKEAERKGILVVAAAGNEESNIDKKSNAYYPASYGLNNIITVTAHDKNLRNLPSSNYGKRSVDLSAPGHRIKSSFPNSRSGFLTGTSQATAFVSGAAALIKSKYPHLSAKKIKDILNKSSKKEITLMTKCKSGGRLDVMGAVLLADTLYTKKVALSTSNKKSSKSSRKIATEGKIYYRMAN